MHVFKITILGCGSAMPDGKHMPSSQLIECNGHYYICDAGEGMSYALHNLHINYNKVEGIFITHHHGDHILGLISYIMVMSIGRRTKDLHIYCTKKAKEFIEIQREYICPNLSFNIVFHIVNKDGMVYADERLRVDAVHLIHSVECFGYIFYEKPQKRPNLDMDAIERFGVSKEYIRNIIELYEKNPNGMLTPPIVSGCIHISSFFKPLRKPSSYAYITDNRTGITKYMGDYISRHNDQMLLEKLKDVSCLYHECSFMESEIDNAVRYGHSCASDVAELAKEAQVKTLLIGHISARYSDELKVLDECRKIFPETYLTNEGMEFIING